MKVEKLGIPPIIRKIFPLMSIKEYTEEKNKALFRNYTVRICEDCYLNICTGTPAGGILLRSKSPNSQKNIMKYSKVSNVLYYTILNAFLIIIKNRNCYLRK